MSFCIMPKQILIKLYPIDVYRFLDELLFDKLLYNLSRIFLSILTF
jgi:hypothetical protein